MQTDPIDTLFQQARTLHHAGDVDAAIASYRQVLAAEPMHFRALNNLGDCLDRQGLHAQAAEAFRAAVEAAPGEARPHYNLGRQLQQRGASAEAETHYRRALELDESLADARLNLARLLDDSARHEEAQTLLLRAAELDPGAGLPHLLRGHSLMGQGRTRDALAAYQAALARQADAHGWFSLGCAQETLREFDAAIDSFNRSLALEPASRSVRQGVARVLDAAGRRDEAIAVLRRWLAAEPDDPLATHFLASLGAAATPERASDGYVAQTFDSFADSFDQTLDRLQYRAPQWVADALGAAVGTPAGTLDILDAGCGTGLCGPLLAPHARQLTGVDLSPGMLAKARARAVYAALAEGELCAHLRAHPAQFDAVVSADTLCYFGALEDVFDAAHGALRPAGLLVFTVEQATDSSADYVLGRHGRYAHSASYIDRALRAHRFAPLSCNRCVLRLEAGQPVDGLVVCARRD